MGTLQITRAMEATSPKLPHRHRERSRNLVRHFSDGNPNTVQFSDNVASSHSPNASVKPDLTPSPSPVPVPFPSKGPIEKEKGGRRGFMSRKGSGYDSDGDVRARKESKKETKKEKEERGKEEKWMKEIEAKAIKDAKNAAKEAKKVNKKGSKKKDGNTTDYESDGGYLSEAPSQASGKVKKSGSSFFRRKSKPKPVDVEIIPPMPAPFIPPVSFMSTSTSSATSSSGSAFLPPIAARFATSSPAPPSLASTLSPAPSFVASTTTPTSVRASPVSTISPRHTPVTSPLPTPTPTSATSNSTTASHLRDDDSSSSRSSDVSMPTSLPTSTSTSSHKKPHRPGLFGFGGSSDSDRVKLNISSPLTASRTPGSSNYGASPIHPKSAPIMGSGSGKGKPALELEMASAYAPGSRDISPAASQSSYVMVTPTGSTPSPARSKTFPQPAPPAQGKKGRPLHLHIQHPHEYNGTQAMQRSPSRSTSPLLPPRRSHSPMPPPTPPPSGPLPHLPPHPHAELAPGPNSAPPTLAPPHVGQQPGSRSTSPIQRGREMPFPSQSKREMGNDRLDGYSARMAVPRYRGLYGLEAGTGTGHTPTGSGDSSDRHIPATMITPADSDDEEDEDDLDPRLLADPNQIRKRFNIMDRERFSAASVPVTEPDRYHGSFASERDDSFTSNPDDSFAYEQLNSFSFSAEPEHMGSQDLESGEGRPSVDDDKSIYPDEDKTAGRRTMYAFEGRDSRYYDDDGRFSRYSATPSVYDVLDNDRSGDARDRFVKRVAAMYEDGREVAEVPPVPKIPERMIKGTGVGRRKLDA